MSDSRSSTSSSPGIARSSARGSARTFWPWPRWHGSWYVTRIRSGPERAARQHLGHVGDLAAERGRAVTPGRILAQQVAVALHVGAAAGGVDDDGVHARRLEGGDVGPRQLPGGLRIPGVGMEGAAAAL